VADLRLFLDTNICVYILNERPAHVAERFNKYATGDIGVSSVVVAELAFGAAKSRKPETRDRLEHFLLQLICVPFDEEAAWHYGALRAILQTAGTLIGPNDLLIAAHALSTGLPLVTNNVSEFERVPGLNVENWFQG